MALSQYTHGRKRAVFFLIKINFIFLCAIVLLSLENENNDVTAFSHCVGGFHGAKDFFNMQIIVDLKFSTFSCTTRCLFY